MTLALTEKVNAILSEMTLEEKIAQMMQISYRSNTREESLRWAKCGAGSFLHVLGDDAREVQKAALNSRLGIPVIFGIDAIHGHGLNEHATIFPTQLAAACSWNTDILEEMGRVTAREVATDGLHWTFSPVLCLGRDTRWGRINETFGEDPYLTGELGAAIIRGYQGESLDSDESILACAKHYIGYGEAVGARDACDTQMTYRKMRETFLPPFKKAIDAGCATVMTAYGSIDGTPFTVDKHTMKDILRDELGFDGFVVTDWNNVHSLVHLQYVSKDAEEASAATAEAGNDMIMRSEEFYEGALAAVRSGRLSEAVIDEAVRNILTMKLRMGLFEKPEKKGVPGCIGCDEHQQAALRAARKSMTMLRNNGILPLKDTVQSIAVIGPNADDVRALYGDWTYFTHPRRNYDREGVRPYVTYREGIEAACEKRGIKCLYHKGCGVVAEDTDNIAGAMQAAEQADIVVLVVGDQLQQVGEHKDRANLDLSGRQMELFYALKATGKPIIAVLAASKPLCIGAIAEQADAILCPFNSGAYGGQVAAEVLFGELNPSGRLPISFPHHSGQVPVYYNALPGWHGTQADWQCPRYCDMPETSLFAFGEGMGFAPFTYSNLTFNTDSLMAEVDVTNKGDVAGTETVQVYFRDMVSSVMLPMKQLIAYKQVELEPGETKRVMIKLDKMDFSMVNHNEERVVEPGEFKLMMGHSSKDADLMSVQFVLA